MLREETLLRYAERAVKALNLDICATHTDTKKQRNTRLCLVETAARIGGTAIARQLEIVLGIDIVDSLTRILLGKPALIARDEALIQSSAAAGLQILGADAEGTSWRTEQAFHPERIDWNKLAGNDIHITVERSLSSGSGATVSPYDPSSGVMNAWGVVLLRAPSFNRMVLSCRDVQNGLEEANSTSH